ncbi:Transcription initiation factor TFIID subunit 6 [Borealophlyctis nickersoniae]|nr:Transcription initiation factor TFIID subunit 6 [Borealophlyctis nickersoniae]
MSVFPKETVQAIADSVGAQLKDEVANALVQDAEYRLREIVHEARKFMRHSKRSKLTADDVNHALRVRNVEPLYGYTSGAPSKFKIIPQASQRLYYVEDQEVDLDDIIYGRLPPVPINVTYTSHWLAVEGVQPAIVQNPSLAELQESPAAPTSSRPAMAAAQAEGKPEPLVKQVLTKELQMYYERITDSLLSHSEAVRNLALESISKDPGIQPLLPYFVSFIAEKVTKNVRHLPITWAMMRLTRAMLSNPNLFVDPYLHQLVPNILTCIVAKRLSEQPTDDHWALRSFAAQLVAHICHKFGTAFPTLQARVTKTLLRAFLDPLKPLTTNYGAMVGLAELGPEVVRLLVVPNVKEFGATLNPRLEGEGLDASTARSHEARRCFEAMVEILGKHTQRELEERQGRGEGNTIPRLRQELEDAYGIFAGDVFAYVQGGASRNDDMMET